MSSNFPFIPATLTEKQEITTPELPIFKELARNLATMEILTFGGKFYFVEKDEAIKIWTIKTLNRQCTRYTHRAYSNNYGHELHTLIGRYLKGSLLESELKRFIEEALLCNPYIRRLSDFTFSRLGSRVTITFVVTTIYGEFLQETEYLN